MGPLTVFMNRYLSRNHKGNYTVSQSASEVEALGLDGLASSGIDAVGMTPEVPKAAAILQAGRRKCVGI